MTDAVALHSGEYVERYNAKPLDRVRNLAARMELPPGTRIADFACGNGMLAQVLGNRDVCYVGVDFSPDFIASARDWAARSGLANCSFECADIIAFCAPRSQAFDAAATLDFSEHIDDEAAVAIYAAIRKSLKPGGILYLHSPNRDFFLERAKQVGIIPQFPEHIAVRNTAEMTAILEQAGFAQSDITVRQIAHYNVLAVLHPLAKLPWIGKFLAARLWIEARA
jgi:2-polyprenyl-3-methyl-5-hydroxy-6-metoxy-1,4-benzoquinol methylase